MSRTVTAMFDSRSEAEEARQRLTTSNIDAERVRIIDKSSSGGSSSFSQTDTMTGGQEGQGFWSSLKDMFLPDEDRQAYGEGINRGGFLLCAEVDEDQADEAVQILEQSSSVDFDERERGWRSEGWSGYSAGAGTGAFAGAGSTGFGTDADSGQSRMGTSAAMTDSFTGSGSTETTGQSFAGTTGERSTTVAEEHIPIVEEQLRVGKREVSRGGTRVRSYVREVPVHEQVSLREEHVSVERRPLTGETTEGAFGADTFQERDIEMTETAEEAVIDKKAVAREELVVRKTAEERVESIDDTVRRTEVDVDEGMREGAENRSALFGSDKQTGYDNATGTGVTGSGTARPSDLSDADSSGNMQDRSRGF